MTYQADIFYASIFENKETTEYYDPEYLAGYENIFDNLVSDVEDERIRDIIKVYDVSKKNLKIISDVQNGETVCGTIK